MRKFSYVFILLFLSTTMGMTPSRQEIELECVKRHHATRTCHYNFLVDGIPHRYLDSGCKEKKDDIIKNAKAGKLALAKDWKIECPEKKDKPH